MRTNPSDPALDFAPYGQLQADYRAGRDVWHRITERLADELRDVLPPIYFPGGFAMSEPWNHTAEDVPVYACVACLSGLRFMRLATVAQARESVRALRAALEALGAGLPAGGAS